MTEDDLARHAGVLTGVAGWLLDGSTLALQWTEAAFRLHGLQPAANAPTLDTVLACIDRADRERVRHTWLTCLSFGRPCDLSYGLLSAGGAPQRVRCVAEFQRLPGGGCRLVGALQPLRDAPSQAFEASLEFAVAAAGVGVWEMDLITGDERWSDQTLALYGLPPGTRAPTRPEWYARFLHADDRGRVDERAADFMATRRPYELDYRIRRASDGALRWMHSRAAFAFGGERRVVGVTIDITEEREAEVRAQEATRLLEHAATQVGFGFGYRDPEGERGDWSVQMKRLFGLPDDAPTPDRSQLGALISEQDRPRVARQMARPIAPGELREVEFQVRRRNDGRLRTLITRSSTEYDAAGRPQFNYFAVIDVTELREKDLRMRQLLGRLQLATEASGVGTWERDARTGGNHWDAITLALFDLPPGAPALDRPEFLARIHPDDRARVAGVLSRADTDMAPLDVEYRVPQPGGGVRWLRTRGRVEFADDGQPLRSIGVCFDTTAQREAEAALHARALAERANAAKTEFLSRMSHELRTPLNAVLGFAQLLSLDHADPLSASQRERVDHIQSAGWHLLALVNDVLDLSRIESQQAQLVFGEVDVADLVGDCLSMAAPLAQAQRVDMQAACDPGLHAWADATRLKQVLLNLLSNAVKYNKAGGRVDVQVRAEPPGQVAFLVRDTGAGLTAEQLARLFEPFNRLGRETSAIEGTGLGLALSKLLVEQMGGQISALSTLGVGSEFRFSVPSTPAAAE